MHEFDVSPVEGFSPTLALERMLRLLLDLFDEVQEYRRHLILTEGPDVLDYHLDEAFIAALRLARDDTRDLIRRLQAVDFSLEDRQNMRLDGPILRFKMMAIKVALYEANTVHPFKGKAIRRGWPLYRRALISVFNTMNAPLIALIELVDGPRGPLEFKQGIESLIVLNSASAS